MTVTIHIPRLTNRGKPLWSPGRTRGRKPSARDKATAVRQGVTQERAGRSGTIVEKLLLGLFLALPLVTLVQTLLARTGEYNAARPAMSETVLAGPRWEYVVPFAVSNKKDIERLIECESGGRNISELDSDGVISDGVLQFHRGPKDTLSNGTWEDFSRASGLTGSPKNPVEAIRMTDWAISHGLGPRWTCWRTERLSPGY
jgi:hypothetical protein